MGFRSLLLSAMMMGGAAGAAEKPNILVILLDDLGYGDPASFNPDSRIRTPNLDRLSAQGMRFTNAHSPASYCVPSRYGLLTGRYPHRTTWDIDKRSIIDPGRPTLATVLRQAGYRTGMVGKWHLGFDTGNRFGCDSPLQGGPVDRGFDYFFGMHASLDIAPYFYIENRRCVEAPTRDIAAGSSPDWSPIQGAFWREGKIAPGFAHPDAQETFVRKSVDFLAGHRAARPGAPFLLYLALTGPHTPWLPKTPSGGGAGLYGDFVAHVDAGVGRVLSALDSLGFGGNTLVLLSSDNGPVWYPEDVTRFGHESAGGLRGMKLDAWEAGHRVPLIARWPGRIAPATSSRELVSLTDVLATCAGAAGARLPAEGGEDSHDLLPALTGDRGPGPIREALVTSGGSHRTIQKGDWKLITGLGSGGFSPPKTIAPAPDGPQGQLYDLAADPSERVNLWLERRDIVASLTALLAKYDAEGRSAPRMPAPVARPPGPPPPARARPIFLAPGRPACIPLPSGAKSLALHAPDGRRVADLAAPKGTGYVTVPADALPAGLWFAKARF